MKSAAEKKATPKISTKIWRPVLERLEQKMAASCLRRDAYLNKVLEVELDHLDTEIGTANSVAAHAFITKKLDQLPDRKLVSLTLRPELVERLNNICERKRIVRDAFFNRLFLLLAASPKTVNRLLHFDDDWRTALLREYRNETFFTNTFDPIEADINPFWAIRDWIETISGKSSPHDEGIYSLLLDSNHFKGVDLTGLNCYIPDQMILDHPAELESRNQLDDLLAF